MFFASVSARNASSQFRVPCASGRNGDAMNSEPTISAAADRLMTPPRCASRPRERLPAEAREMAPGARRASNRQAPRLDDAGYRAAVLVRGSRGASHVQPSRQPGVDFLIKVPAVVAVQDPVVRVGPDQQAARHLQSLERAP